MTAVVRPPTRETIAADDVVITFRTERSNIQGRLVRLGSTADDILRRHAVPDIVRQALGEAIALSSLLGSVLGDDGKIILQTRTDGAIPFVVTDYEAPGKLRGYARQNATKIAALNPDGASLSTRDAIGDGNLAITLEHGAAADRYQGIASLDGASLAETAASYFENYEQLATFVRLAAGQHFIASTPPTGDRGWSWRAGGLMLQDVAGPREISTRPNEQTESDDWNRVRTLAATIEDHELLDPTLSADRLLLRLFHEEGVLVTKVVPLQRYCRCSRARVTNVLGSFEASDLTDMLDENGRITVTCEFCATVYAFDPAEVGAETK